jgi:hypothetical protein
MRSAFPELYENMVVRGRIARPASRFSFARLDRADTRYAVVSPETLNPVTFVNSVLNENRNAHPRFAHRRATFNR